MTWDELRHNDRQEQEQLDVARALIEDATKDTVLWLQANPSAEERVHVVALQARLADLDRIAERRMERRVSSRDSREWSEAARDVLSLLEKAKQVRGSIVGNGLARLMDHLPQRLPGQRPHQKLSEPVRTVNTARILTRAPRPPSEIGGGGYFASDPKPTRMPSRPDDFPSDFWPRAVVILSKLIQKFPNQEHLRKLCEHAVPEMTPLYCEAVETGKMKAGTVLNDRCGMEELLRLLLIANDPGPSSWGLSNQAWEILQAVKTATWGKLAHAIAEVQQRTAIQTKPAPSAAPKVQSTSIIPGQFEGLPSWQLTELMRRRVEAAGRLRTDENQTAHSPDPVLGAFNRSGTGVASEPTPAQNHGKTEQGVERRLRSRKPERDDPEVAKRAALVRSNPNTPATEMCDIFDRGSVPLPARWQEAGFKTWSQAHKNANYRSRIDTLISKQRAKG